MDRYGNKHRYEITFNISKHKYDYLMNELKRLEFTEMDLFELMYGIYTAKMRIQNEHVNVYKIIK